MDPILTTKREIEQMIGVSGADAEVFWSLSKKCALIAGVPAVTAGAKWGPGLIAAGTITLPGLGTISGTTATVLLMGGMWGSNYAACMSILPGLLQFKKQLQEDAQTLKLVRGEVGLLIRNQRHNQCKA